MKQSGIYQIQSKVKPDRIYIGSAVDISKRWREHLNQLRVKKHHNSKLQRHYNKYGQSDLQFSILLFCDKKELIRNEQYFIDNYKPYFNILKIAYSALGYKHSKSTIAKQKQHLREIHMGEKNPQYGKHLSDEAKRKAKETIAKKRNNYN
jgi:group I intron endonuclease